MTTRFRIVDEEGDVVWIGPGDGFPTQTEATLFLILTPNLPLTWRIQSCEVPPFAVPLPAKPRLAS